MRKVLLAVVVLGIAILLQGGSHGAPRVTDISPASDDAPAQSDNLVTVPLPSGAPSVRLPGASEIGPVIGESSDPSSPSSSEAVTATTGGGASMSVVDGTTTTPQPGTCSGMSHSKETSENGMRSRTRISHEHCPDPNGDDSSCDSPCDD